MGHDCWHQAGALAASSQRPAQVNVDSTHSHLGYLSWLALWIKYLHALYHLRWRWHDDDTWHVILGWSFAHHLDHSSIHLSNHVSRVRHFHRMVRTSDVGQMNVIRRYPFLVRLFTRKASRHYRRCSISILDLNQMVNHDVKEFDHQLMMQLSLDVMKDQMESRT